MLAEELSAKSLPPLATRTESIYIKAKLHTWQRLTVTCTMGTDSREKGRGYARATLLYLLHLVAAGDDVIGLQRHLLAVLEAGGASPVHAAQRQHLPLALEAARAVGIRARRTGCRRPDNSSVSH